MTNTQMKNIQEWAKEKGYQILDPDGFDRSDPEVMTRLRTEEEFLKGFHYCTIRPLKVQEEKTNKEKILEEFQKELDDYVAIDGLSNDDSDVYFTQGELKTLFFKYLNLYAEYTLNQFKAELREKIEEWKKDNAFAMDMAISCYNPELFKNLEQSNRDCDEFLKLLFPDQVDNS